MTGMTSNELVDSSRRLLEQFVGVQTGDVISIIAIALQMAICYGARSKADAVDMIRRIAEDSIREVPVQYDIIQAFEQKSAEMSEGHQPH